MERQIKLTDPKLHALITEKGVLVEEGRKLYKEIEKQVAVQAKHGIKIQKLKDKMIPLVKALPIEISEFEDIIEFGVEGNDVTIKIIDQVEAYKSRLREKKKQDGIDALKNEVKRPTKKK